jgi:puromycin-sensitive aminopeptidase
MKSSQPSIRLAPHVTPITYRITLKPDLEAHTFQGEETIEISIDKPTREITLHSKDLDITLVEHQKGKVATSATIAYNDELETATFTFPDALVVGKHLLRIVFRGILADNMRGFYKSQYVLDGKTHTMATTQFEATDARRCIPCFDEPAHKAVFHVKLIVPVEKTAISNTLPVEVKEHEAGFKAVTFAPTPKMSTYLLAFIVGDFEFTERKTKNGVMVRVYATPGKKDQTQFALDCAVKTLEFYENYFDIKYPLNTLDMIAIPDFASGAMENWGAVTYRETALLVDPKNTSTRMKQWVALVVAHELAHQWFGNLVTMEWWTHLWLNEGFASYIEYLAVDKLFPEWNIWTQFAFADLGAGLRLDALKHTHPIEVDVHNPNEIGEIFDEVSYSKGASIIRMLAGYLGERQFRDGLRHYLKKHSYKNASTIHLWEAFEKVSKKPVQKVMQEWTSKPGYPLIEIKEKGDVYEIRQSRFFSSVFSAEEVSDKTVWSVPVNYRGDREVTHDLLLTAKKDTIFKSEDLWKKWNFGETGFYRVKYEKSALEDLRHPIIEGRLPAIDRLGIIRDLFALSEAGHVETKEALFFAENYSTEMDYTVWIEVLSGMAHVYNLVSGSNLESLYKIFALTVVEKSALTIGWEKRTNEEHTTTLLRSSLLFHAGMYGNKEILNQAQKIFKNRVAEPINADIRGVVYNLVAMHGGVKEYKDLLATYNKAESHEEKNRLIHALGQFTDKALLTKTLEFGLSKEVRLQDRNGVFGAVLSNPVGRTLAWEFMKTNWTKLIGEYGEGGHLLARLVKPLNHFTDKKEADDIKKFFAKNKAPAAARTVDQVLEHIYSNDAWKKRDWKGIESFLKAL